MMMGDMVAKLMRHQEIGSHFHEVRWPRTLKSAARILLHGSILLFERTRAPFSKGYMSASYGALRL